jgi:hypothetical protein
VGILAMIAFVVAKMATVAAAFLLVLSVDPRPPGDIMVRCAELAKWEVECGYVKNPYISAAWFRCTGFAGTECTDHECPPAIDEYLSCVGKGQEQRGCSREGAIWRDNQLIQQTECDQSRLK